MYRPVRLGFLVREGNVDDLVTAAGISTLLYGGIYNPIIPISANTDFAESLLNIFNVDVIYPVAKDEQITQFTDKYPLLRTPHFVSTEIFYEDHITKKNAIMYLDSLNVVNYYWEEEFKHKARRLPADYNRHVIIKWSENHPFKNLFSLAFGYYPSNLNLKDDFESNFLEGLHGNVVEIGDDMVFQLGASAPKSITPILLTSSELKYYDERLYGNGIFVGDENDFTDLCLFWNVRATGTIVEFLPRNHLQKFKGSLRKYLKGLNESQPPTSDNKDRITAYCQSAKYDEVKKLIPKIPSDTPIGVFPSDHEVTWNGFNLRPSNFYFNDAQTLASIDKTNDGYKISFSLPEIPKVNRQNPRIEHQSFITSIGVSTSLGSTGEEDAYPEHTLKPPFIRELNGFYGRSIIGNPFKFRVEEYGIRIITECSEYSLSLSPVSYESIISQIFNLAGLKVEISQPGILTKHILQKLNGVEGGRLLKIAGVRRLFDSLKRDDFITQSAASQIIFRKCSFLETELKAIFKNDYDDLISQYFVFKSETGRFTWKAGINKAIDISDERVKELFMGDFRKFENVFSPYGIGPKLKTGDVFRILLRKEFLRAGLELTCDHCKLRTWLSLREIDDYWVCNYCGGRNQTSLHLSNECHWKYRKSGLFAKDNNQEGAIPVILTLLQFHRRLSFSSYGYSPALKIKGNSVNCEIDLCILQNQNMGFEIGIAECKSEGGEITLDDIQKFKSVHDQLDKIGIRCSLIFSKTADSFRSEEIDLFKKLASEKVKCILFLNKELEPHELYEGYETHELVTKYASTLETMAWNSHKVYLSE